MGEARPGASRRVRALTGLLVWGLACSAAPERPNVVLISIDTLRADHCSFAGYPRPTTPGLDALAREGVTFSRAYAPTASTAPSHATLFTGLPPMSHGLVKNGLVLAGEHPTLAEAFAERGYQTAAVVSSFVLDRRFGLDRGFADYDAEFAESSVHAEDWEGHAVGGFDRRAAEASDRALAWLHERRDPTRPFFLFVHYFDPHSPYGAPGEWASRFLEPDMAPDTRAWWTALYDAEVAYTDGEISRLLRGLAAAGRADDTLVVVTADHGEGLGDHGVIQHAAHLYEEAVRVPLVFRWPDGLEHGRVLDDPVSLLDLKPTLLALVDGGDPPEPTVGRNLAPRLRGRGGPDPESAVFLERRLYAEGSIEGVPVRGRQFAVRVGRWKLIDSPGLGRRELYELERDPGERTDRYASEPEVAARLMQQLDAWRRAHERPIDAPSLQEADRRALEALGYVE